MTDWKEVMRQMGLGIMQTESLMLGQMRDVRWYEFRRKWVLLGMIHALSEMSRAFRLTWTGLNAQEGSEKDYHGNGEN